MMTDKQRIAALRTRDRHMSRADTRRPFAGVDGEGGDINGQHEYLLLRAGDHLLETGAPLTAEQCLNFLSNLPPNRIYVSFFFDYDITMILRRLPVERLTRLLDRDCRRIPGKPCSSFPVDVGRYQIDYLARKEFKVRHRIENKPDGSRAYSPWVIIHDTGSFFQCSFVTALRRWFSDDQSLATVIEKIAEGKEQRHDFGAVTEYEREYNNLECIMLARLMERFRDMCDMVDLRPSKWQGPGNLVSTQFKKVKLPGNKDIQLFDIMPDFMQMANSAYYGGRFEVAEYGQIKGPVEQWDINSAYANTYRYLPCLIHGKWEYTDQRPESGIYVGDVSFKHKRGLSWGTLPVRAKSDGVLLFPEQGRGHYWSPELRVAERYASLSWHGGYKYTPDCTCQSFDWIYDLYNERKRLGKDARGNVLKIVLASTYGKLAQSVGCAPYSNPVWAGLIVANCRATLINAALQRDGGKDVVMLATDGLFVKGTRDLPEGTELGQWTKTTYPEMFIVQSGVYFLPGMKPKTRGVPQQRVIAHEAQFRAAWSTYLTTGQNNPVNVPLNVFIGLRLALARGKLDTAGQWVDVSKEVGFDWSTKRCKPRIIGTSLTTRPIPGSDRLVSEPYQRIIGGIKVEQRLELADQPDWGEQL